MVALLYKNFRIRGVHGSTPGIWHSAVSTIYEVGLQAVPYEWNKESNFYTLLQAPVNVQKGT
jgi:hypothetical protein